MELDLGGQEVVANPTLEEVRHYLRYMRADSPYIVLSDSNGGYIQAIFTTEKEQYRVEYRDAGKQFYTHTGYEDAVSLFHCFMEDGCNLREQAKWKRLYQLPPKVDSFLAWVGLIVVLVLLAAFILHELGVL